MVSVLNWRRAAAAVPQPTSEGNNLNVLIALKEAVEIIMGQRKGSKAVTAVTWQDLVDLGLIESDQIPND